MRRLTDHPAFSGDADGRARVVACAHAAGKVRRAKGLDGWRRPGLDFILEYDEAEKP